VGCAAGGLRSAEPWRAPDAPVAEVPLRYRGIVEESRVGTGPGADPSAEIDLRLIDPPSSSGLASGARMRVAVWGRTAGFEVGEHIELVARARRPQGLCNGGVDSHADASRRRGIAAEASVNDARALSRLGVERRWWSPADLGRLWRSRTDARIRSALGPTEAAVVRALVLGDQRDIGADVRRVFARTGTTHVLSVSGLHVAMVGAAVLALTVSVAARIPWLAARVSARAVGAVAAMPAVAAYAWLTSPGAPILRSAIMAELYLVAIAVRRRFDFPTALAVAAVVVGLFEPDAPWDVSAQLSFVTILWIWSGMRLLEGAPAQRPRARRPPSLRVATAALAAVAASALATLGSSPILAWHFGEVSVVGIVANPIVVPLMGWGALGCGLVGLVLAPLTAAVSYPAFWLSGLCVRLSLAVATALSDLPWAVVPVGWRTALICSTVVTCGALPAPSFRHRIGRALVGAVLASALAIAASDPAPPLRVSFLDVGQGDAALVELGADLRFTVDGGGLARGREPGDRVLLPALRRRGIERLDGSVVSHPEWDHFGGIGRSSARENRRGLVGRRRGESGAWRRFDCALSRNAESRSGSRALAAFCPSQARTVRSTSCTRRRPSSRSRPTTRRSSSSCATGRRASSSPATSRRRAKPPCSHAAGRSGRRWSRSLTTEAPPRAVRPSSAAPLRLSPSRRSGAGMRFGFPRPPWSSAIAESDRNGQGRIGPAR
jgi:ComEC/Rec2-related protein